MRRLAFVILAIGLTAFSNAAGAGMIELLPSRGKGPVSISGDKLTTFDSGKRVVAEGNVRLAWSGFTLEADRVSYDGTVSTVEGRGGVKLADAEGNLVEGDGLTLNIDEQLGELEKGRLTIPSRGLRVWGDSFKKTGPTGYESVNGGFSGCDGTFPDWRVTADRVEVDVGGYLEGWGATLWIESVPVAWLPYIVVPVIVERQTGFLPPRVGASERDGFFVVLKHYWAFAENADLLTEVAYMSRRGWTEKLGIRYVLGEDHAGEFSVKHGRDRLDNEDRVRLRGEHDSVFAPGYELDVRLAFDGDKDYGKEYGEDVRHRGVRRNLSYLSGTTGHDWGSLFIFGRYEQDLVGPEGEVLQKLPSFGFMGADVNVWGPLSFAPHVEATRFWRQEGEDGSRLLVEPILSADAAVGPHGLYLRTGYRQNIYLVEDEQSSHGGATAEGGVKTSIVGDWGKTIHLLEPDVSLVWTEEGRGDETPDFDDADEFSNQTGVRLRIDNRWFAEELRAVAGLELERTLVLGNGRGIADDDWTPYTGEGFLTPVEGFKLWGDGQFQPTDGWRRWALSTEVVIAGFGDLSAGYRYLRNEASVFEGTIGIHPHPRVRLEYQHYHSRFDNRILEQRVNLNYNHPCWIIKSGWSRSYRQEENDYDNRISVTVEFAGLFGPSNPGGLR